MRFSVAAVALAALLPALASAQISASTYRPPSGMLKNLYYLDVDLWSDPIASPCGNPSVIGAEAALQCATREILGSYILHEGAVNENPGTAEINQSFTIPPIVVLQQDERAPPGGYHQAAYWAGKPLTDRLRAALPGLRTVIGYRGDLHWRTASPTGVGWTPADPLETASGINGGCPAGSLSHDSVRSAPLGNPGDAVCNDGVVRVCNDAAKTYPPCFTDDHCDGSDQCVEWSFGDDEPGGTQELGEWVATVPASAYAGAPWKYTTFRISVGMDASLFCGMPFAIQGEDCTDPTSVAMSIPSRLPAGRLPVFYASSSVNLDSEQTNYSISSYGVNFLNPKVQRWQVAYMFQRAADFGYAGAPTDTGKGLHFWPWTKYGPLPYWDHTNSNVSDATRKCGGSPGSVRYVDPGSLKSGTDWLNWRLNALSRSPDPGFEWRAGLPDCDREGTTGHILAFAPPPGPYEVENAVRRIYGFLWDAIQRENSPFPDAGIMIHESSRYRSVEFGTCSFMPEVCRRSPGVRRFGNIGSLANAATRADSRRNPIPVFVPPDPPEPGAGCVIGTGLIGTCTIGGS